MSTKAKQDAWFATAVGKYMNPDKMYGYQCKDVADDYCIALWGDWVNTVRPGNGKDVFANANPAYFTKIANNPKDPAQIPAYGDIINWGYSKAVPEGHVAVVVSATQSRVTVIQQDGYKQTPAQRIALPYLLPTGSMVIGWLRPILHDDIAAAQAKAKAEADRLANLARIEAEKQAEIARIAEIARKEAEEKAKQAELDRIKAEAEAKQAEKNAHESDHSFIQVLKELWNLILSFMTKKGEQ
jgi:hypothetical protein